MIEQSSAISAVRGAFAAEIGGNLDAEQPLGLHGIDSLPRETALAVDRIGIACAAIAATRGRP